MPVRSTRTRLHLAALVGAVVPFACATQQGNIRDNIALTSNVAEPSCPPEPSRPPEPARPGSFPPITTLWERSSDNQQDSLLASLTPPQRPVRPQVEQSATPPVRNDGPSTGIAHIPPLPDNPTETQRTFHEQASRAVTRIVERDYDDPSVAQSLREQLISKPELASMRGAWEQLLNDAIARAKVLQQLSPVLRLLRAAYANSKRDPKGFYRDIDQPSCRQAFVLLFDVGVDAIEMPVTVPPLQRMSLREIESLCRDSNDAVLSERVFPETVGNPQLRKIVRRMFMTTYTDTNVRRVVIPHGWRETDGGRRRTLRAVIGVQRENAFPNDPCTMEEVSISQTKTGGRFEATECCDIHSSVAITCDQIE